MAEIGSFDFVLNFSKETKDLIERDVHMADELVKLASEMMERWGFTIECEIVEVNE